MSVEIDKKIDVMKVAIFSPVVLGGLSILVLSELFDFKPIWFAPAIEVAVIIVGAALVIGDGDRSSRRARNASFARHKG